ncbi:hypothetical protein GCM10022409_25760 [Hymenobacter glaciei]|uniref:Uncharacterized protein n=1 Tax=Hymenobacter glaciei TaxID=877209 RepID=A0ABP7UAA1_9BACT
MSRLVFLFFLLIGSSMAALPSRAQERPTTFFNDSTAQVARDDTAMALQRLFRLQRHTSVRSLLLGTVLAGATAYSLANDHPETTYQRVSTIGIAAVGGYGLLQVVTGAVQQWRFRARQEERLLDRLDQAQPLPRWVRRKLVPSYFGVRARLN